MVDGNYYNRYETWLAGTKDEVNSWFRVTLPSIAHVRTITFGHRVDGPANRV